MTTNPEQFVPLWLPPLLAVAAVVNQDPRDTRAHTVPWTVGADLIEPLARGSPAARVAHVALTLYAVLGVLSTALWRGCTT
jgi:hypothetical protein